MDEKQELLNAKLFYVNGIDNFHFSTRTISHDDYVLLRQTLSLKYKTGQLKHQARPYNTEIGHSKLYRSESGSIHRCVIQDVVTCNGGNQLAFLTTIKLIDTGKLIYRVPINYLYDYPDALRHLEDIERAAKPARIWLGEPIPKNLKDKQINEYFKTSVDKNSARLFRIKTLEYDEEEDIYYIDIIDNSGKSLINHLREKFYDRLKQFEEVETDEQQENNSHSITSLSSRRPIQQLVNSSRLTKSYRARSPPPRRYYGAVHYFKDKLRQPETKPFFKNMFFRVRLINWSSPECFYVLPDDKAYFGNHDAFQRDLINLHEYDYNNENLIDRNPYHVGDKCWFINRDDPKLGKWLRGIIDEEAHAIKDKYSSEYESDESVYDTELNDYVVSTNQLLYCVRSIDFGFSVQRTINNLRRVKDEQLFSRRGSWALKCRLFGIDVLHHEAGNATFSQTCLDAFDKWCRCKMKNISGSFSPFYLLFKTNLLQMPDTLPNDNSVDVTFFHRHEAPYTIADCLKKRNDRVSYHCLNVFLIDRGLAGDFLHKLKKKSNVDLDQYVINQWVLHDRIPLC